MGMTDKAAMRLAYQQAEWAIQNHEVPVGAVIVSDTGQVLSQSFNQVIRRCDPTAHAEMLVLREAGNRLQNYRLNNTTLYVTLEPCLMCAAAMVHARIKRLVFATRDLAAGAAGSVYNILNDTKLNHAVEIDEGVLQVECAELLRAFFKRQRSAS